MEQKERRIEPVATSSGISPDLKRATARLRCDCVMSPCRAAQQGMIGARYWLSAIRRELPCDLKPPCLPMYSDTWTACVERQGDKAGSRTVQTEAHLSLVQHEDDDEVGLARVVLVQKLDQTTLARSA